MNRALPGRPSYLSLVHNVDADAVARERAELEQRTPWPTDPVILPLPVFPWPPPVGTDAEELES